MESFKVAKTPNANSQNERKEPRCKKKNHKQITNSTKGIKELKIKHEMSHELAMQELFILCGYDFLPLKKTSTNVHQNLDKSLAFPSHLQST